MAGSTTVQLRIPDEVLARIDEASEGSTRTAWLLAAAERQLDSRDGTKEISGTAALPVTYEIPSGGIESPGVACAWPTCWARNTARYGVLDPAELTRTDYAINPRDEEGCGLVLCPPHAARLGGLRYARPRAVPARVAVKSAEPA